MIRVCLMRREGRPFYEAQWRDPVTGRKRTRSTGTPLRREAERFAARLEEEINAEGTPRDSRLTWQQFVQRYDEEKLSGLAPRSRLKVLTALNAFERLIQPARVSVVGPVQVSQFASLLRKEKFGPKNRKKNRTESAVWSNMSCLRTALRWAHRHRLLPAPVHVEMPKRPPGMKGRPVTAEEFDRLLLAVDKVVPAAQSAAWKHLLRGLWWSGLRLGEALDLHWTDDSRLCVIMSGRRPMLYIRGHAEKGRKNRQLPIAPEFAEMLTATPDAEREGYVFLGQRNPRPDLLSVSKLLSAIGEKAGVRVSPRKHASAHDLRRAFGLRWALRVMPAVLQELMRHESIQTTMEFYVGRNAEVTADAVWQAVANESANDSRNTGSRPDQPKAQQRAAKQLPKRTR